jgi:hypothetical protein
MNDEGLTFDRKEVESSVIASVGYDKERRDMMVEFKSGELYLYQGVPPIVYDKFLEAESKGSFFNSNIKSIFMSSKMRLTEKDEEAKPKEATVVKSKDREIENLRLEFETLKRKFDLLDARVDVVEADMKKMPAKRGFYKTGKIVKS